MEEKYYEIGEKFSFNGETYEVKEEKIGEQCERCSFRNDCQDNLQCGSNERKDGINVYFEKVENMELGEEQIPDGVIGIEDAKINVDAIKPPTAKENLLNNLNAAVKLFEKETGLTIKTISSSKYFDNPNEPDKTEWEITTILE